MIKLKILIVLYNKNINHSESLKTLCTLNRFFGKFELIIWDNSLTGLKLSDIEDLRKKILPSKLFYKNTPENLPLSKLYNIVIKEFININDYIMLLDDDTSLKESFFSEVFNHLEDSLLYSDVYLPRIINNTILVSPARMYLFFGRYYKKINSGFLKSRFTIAINSGMIISGKFLKTNFQGYDERLRFYGTDTYFMKQLCKKKGKIYILETSLNHDLSFFNEKTTLESKVNRLEQMVSAMNIILKNENYFIKMLFFIYKSTLKLKYIYKMKKQSYYDN